MGFAKASRLANIQSLTGNYSKPEGILWLLTAVLFLIALATFLLKKDEWWVWGVVGVIVSQLLIVVNWQDAKAGTIANFIVLLVAVVAFANWKFNRKVQNDIRQILAENGAANKETVTKEMCSYLPQPVKSWVENSGIVGMEKIHAVRLRQKGWMRTGPEKDKWIPTTAEEYFTIDKPGFVWKVQMKMAPLVPVVGEDRYVNGRGVMNIKAFSLINITNEVGNKVDQGTLQRYLAEICWFPSAALSPYIKWEAIDNTTAKATMSYNGVSGSVTFQLNNKGDMVACNADRYMGSGKKATLEKWIVTSKSYDLMNGIKMPVKSEVTWKLKSGDYTWYKLEITDIAFNDHAMPVDRAAH